MPNIKSLFLFVCLFSKPNCRVSFLNNNLMNYSCDQTTCPNCAWKLWRQMENVADNPSKLFLSVCHLMASFQVFRFSVWRWLTFGLTFFPLRLQSQLLNSCCGFCLSSDSDIPILHSHFIWSLRSCIATSVLSDTKPNQTQTKQKQNKTNKHTNKQQQQQKPNPWSITTSLARRCQVSQRYRKSSKAHSVALDDSKLSNIVSTNALAITCFYQTE